MQSCCTVPATTVRMPRAGSFAVGTRAEVLDRVAAGDFALALWLRPEPEGLAGWLDELPAERLPHGRVLVRPDQAAAAVGAMLAAGGSAPDGPAALFAADVAALVRRFADLTDSPLVDVRVDRVTGNACWKFHRDAVPLRLLATYRGPGTEYVDAGDAEDALTLQRAYAGPLHRFPRFAVGLFRGAGADGVVHRSPPIAGSGTVRLLVCLNPPSDASPEPWVPAPYPMNFL